MANKPPPFPLYEYTDPLLKEIIPEVVRHWQPDLTQFGLDYSMDGMASMTQSWIAPRDKNLALAIRQMLSWNRNLYKISAGGLEYSATIFNDHTYFPSGGIKDPGCRRLVPVSARVTPMLTNQTPEFMKGHMGAPINFDEYSKCVFPAMLTDKYQVNITWAPDEFTNAYSIQYARVEIEPSIRLESISGNNLGIVSLDAKGDANKNGKVFKISTGFPIREAQIMIKITYPWVAKEPHLSTPCIENAGPIGDWWGKVDNGPPMGVLPPGQYLGTVNNKEFLGFPRGRVLYQSAEMVDRQSPVTTRLGYQITHVFVVLTGASWNYSRYEGCIGENGFVVQTNEGQENEYYWPYGATVAITKDGKVYQNNGKAIYPYIHKNFDNLLYYGTPNEPKSPSGFWNA